MKKVLLGFSTVLVVCFTAFLLNTKNVGASDSSGKWIAEYGGGSTPFRCYCCTSMVSAECRVGDTTSNISLCEN